MCFGAYLWFLGYVAKPQSSTCFFSTKVSPTPRTVNPEQAQQALSTALVQKANKSATLVASFCCSSENPCGSRGFMFWGFRVRARV